jgi:aryl-alcohol dehydrogenase-like predicted oxidoreductase
VTAVQYIKLGSAGLEVSRICLGAMTFYAKMDQREAIELVRKAYDKGINFIDTADSYGDGASEEFLAKALAGIRDNVVISTKVYASVYHGRRRAANCSRAHLIKALDASLRRLNTDYIDLYMCHHPDPLTSFEETYSTLDQFVKQGKVRYIGMCNAYAWQVTHVLGLCGRYGWEPPVSLQVSYSLIDRVMENETLPMANYFGLALQVYGPQAAGILAGKVRRGEEPPPGSRVAAYEPYRRRLTDDVFDVVEEVERIAAKYNITMGQFAVLWILSRPGCIVPIVGGSRAEHLEPLFDCPDLQVEQEDLDRLTQMTERYRYQPWFNQPNATAPAPSPNWL